MSAARRSAGVLAALALATVGAGSGCSAILGVHDIEPPLDAGVTSTTVDAMACIADGDLGDPCALCQDQQCCGPYLGCHDDSGCEEYESCVKACDQQGSSASACTLQCSAQNQPGHDLFAPFSACVTDHCFAQCSGDQVDPCDSCLHASCTDEQFACQSDPGCDILESCNESCSGSADFQSCTQVCTQNAPDSTQKLFDAFESCSITYCTAQCSD